MKHSRTHKVSLTCFPHNVQRFLFKAFSELGTYNAHTHQLKPKMVATMIAPMVGTDIAFPAIRICAVLEVEESSNFGDFEMALCFASTGKLWVAKSSRGCITRCRASPTAYRSIYYQ